MLNRITQVPFLCCLNSSPAHKYTRTEKCKDLLAHLLQTCLQSSVVKQGTNLIRRNLAEFAEYPWVHWPETMMTYCPEEKILSHATCLDRIFATSSLFMDGPCRVEISAKRYYAEIMMPFRKSITSY